MANAGHLSGDWTWDRVFLRARDQVLQPYDHKLIRAIAAPGRSDTCVLIGPTGPAGTADAGLNSSSDNRPVRNPVRDE
jgi:hypothetical protein